MRQICLMLQWDFGWPYEARLLSIYMCYLCICDGYLWSEQPSKLVKLLFGTVHISRNAFRVQICAAPVIWYRIWVNVFFNFKLHFHPKRGPIGTAFTYGMTICLIILQLFHSWKALDFFKDTHIEKQILTLLLTESWWNFTHLSAEQISPISESFKRIEQRLHGKSGSI